MFHKEEEPIIGIYFIGTTHNKQLKTYKVN